MITFSLNYEFSILYVFLLPNIWTPYFSSFTIYLIFDDFNGQSTLLGNKNNDLRGELIEQFLAKNDKYVLWMICLTPTFIQGRRRLHLFIYTSATITVSWS